MAAVTVLCSGVEWWNVEVMKDEGAVDRTMTVAE